MKRAGVRGGQGRECSQSLVSTVTGRAVLGRGETPINPSGTVPVARSVGPPGPSLKNSVEVPQPAPAPRPKRPSARTARAATPSLATIRVTPTTVADPRPPPKNSTRPEAPDRHH